MRLVDETINNLKKCMPFRVAVERNADDNERLTIQRITDKNNNEIRENDIEIHIQSLGIDEQYWLDTGAFDF